MDAFRGLTIAGMILVNNPGSWETAYPPLLHAEWHGWTPTDLVFPFFVFIVGVAMRFSLRRRLQAGEKTLLYRKIFRRALILFLLGLFLVNFPHFDAEHLKVTGVLQRIAVVYFCVALLAVNTSWRGQAWVAGVLLLAYWAVMTLVPVPESGAGVLTPAANLAAYVDRLLLPGLMYHGSWDAEGILSTLPACCTALLGLLAGHWICSDRDSTEKVAWLFVVGWAAILAGLVWGIWFPINKGIWTSSFVLFTAGAALQFLAVCYWLIDIKGYRRWFHPAIVFGMNAIAVYSLSELATSLLYWIPIASGAESESLWEWTFRKLFLPWAEPINASLLFAVSYVLLWYLMMSLLYRKRIFIKI